MAATADLVVLEPGGAEPAGDPSVPHLTVELDLAFGERRTVQLEVTEAGIETVCEVLHRVGGSSMLRELSHGINARLRGQGFGEAQLASLAIRIVEERTKVLRAESMPLLEALDVSARQAFEHDLTLASVALRPENFGFDVDQDGNRSVPAEGLEHDLYRQLRSVVAELDVLRRNVRQWAFSIPPNAPTARRQFTEYALEPYTTAMATASDWYPALLVMAPPILRRLAKESPADIEAWEQDAGNATRLDEIIQDELVSAFTNLREEQPGYRDKVLRAADRAVAAARANVTRYWEDSPAEVLGRLHPLWKHPFLVQSAMEQQGYHPGDHGYAVGIESLYAATAAAERSRQEAAELDRMVAWASIGFGVLTLVPVVGQLALAATIVIVAVQTLEEAQKYAEDTTAREALGHQAVRYQVPEPDALGLILGVLQLTSDVALPLVGKLLSKTVLRPTTRVIAAARVKNVLFVGERSADLAGLVMSANSALAERELRRLQLLTLETGRK
jgi:hypothetical protein